MLRIANKWTSPPTLQERIAGLVRPDPRLLLAGGAIVLGGLACYAYTTWRQRRVAQQLLECDVMTSRDEDDAQDEIDEALDESFPASDPPSFNARGKGDVHRSRRNGTAKAKH